MAGTTLNKSSILNTFNEHFFEFIEDIILIIEDNNEIKYARDFFKNIKNINSSSILKAWYYYVYLPYTEQIDKGDISYFLDKNYNNDLKVFESTSNQKQIIDVIDKLREPIKNMSIENIKHSTEYIQNLSKLSKIYISLM